MAASPWESAAMFLFQEAGEFSGSLTLLQSQTCHHPPGEGHDLDTASTRGLGMP